MYVCLFLYLVHLLYHEVGLKYECCWSFLVTLTVCGVTFVPGETAGPSVFPLSAMLFPKPRLILRNPLRQPENFILLFGQQWFVFVCYLFQQQEMVSASDAIVMKLLRVLRDYVVAHNWL